jgi:DNA-binding XRE family transcriptional regulator
MPQKPFQKWFDLVRAECGWTLHEVARKLGISTTTAELTETPLAVVKQFVWDSRDVKPQWHQEAGRPAKLPISPPPPAKAARVGRRRIRPLGLAFTMYRTRPIPSEYLERLCILAARRGTTPAETLRDALLIALLRMEQKAPR